MRTLYAFMLTAFIASAADAQTVETVPLDVLDDRATYDASLTGSEYRDYVVAGLAGQTLLVSLETGGTAYFNILPPGSTGEAIYNGSIYGNETQQQLDVAGDYAVRVYLMGADRSDDRTVRYAVTLDLD